MIHCTVKENLLSHQGFLQNGPDDFFAITLSPIERFGSTCINLFPESFVCGMHDASVPQDLGELLSDETIDDWDPKNRASFKMLTKIGVGEY